MQEPEAADHGRKGQRGGPHIGGKLGPLERASHETKQQPAGTEVDREIGQPKSDGARIGRPLLAFVHVDTANWSITQQVLGLAELNEVEEIHTITGKSAMLLKVRVRDTQALELLLARIHQIEGITSTTSDIALTSYLERGPLPDNA